MKKLSLALLLAGLGGLATKGADWPQFRGSRSNGVATREELPASLGLGKPPVWRSELPGRGVSGPIVVGHRVFLTAASGTRQDRLHVLAFDARSGKKLWQRTIWATGPTASHPKTSMAAPTPASDGTHVVALFGTNDLVCLDVDGNVCWIRSLYPENPGATDGRGLASSPLIVDGKAIIQVESQNTSFAAAVDLKTGANLWQKDRPRRMCWSSPIVLPGRSPAAPLVLLQGSTRLSAVDAATGREVWGLERDSDPIASSATDGKVLLVPGGKGLAAFELQGDGKPPKLLWEKLPLSPDTPSPVLVGERVYVLRGSILVCANSKRGEEVGRLRLRGQFSASPVAAGGRLYCVNESGDLSVVSTASKESRVSERGRLGETVLATPAIADGALFLRSDRSLWRFGKP